MAECIEILKEQFLHDSATVKFYFAMNNKKKSGFVVKKDQQFFVYLNECQHLEVELDWQENEFFEEEKKYIVCATHGALYEPSSGLCISGPCIGAHLKKLHILKLLTRSLLTLRIKLTWPNKKKKITNKRC